MVGAFGNLAFLQDFRTQPELEMCTKFLHSFYIPRLSHQSDNITEE
jgi:hypothetical protein